MIYFVSYKVLWVIWYTAKFVSKIKQALQALYHRNIYEDKFQIFRRRQNI